MLRVAARRAVLVGRRVSDSSEGTRCDRLHTGKNEGQYRSKYNNERRMTAQRNTGITTDWRRH